MTDCGYQSFIQIQTAAQSRHSITHSFTTVIYQPVVAEAGCLDADRVHRYREQVPRSTLQSSQHRANMFCSMLRGLTFVERTCDQSIGLARL